MTKEEIGVLIESHEIASLRPGLSKALGRALSAEEIESVRDERKAWLEARIADVNADIGKSKLYAAQLDIYLASLQSALADVTAVAPVLPEPEPPPPPTWWEQMKAAVMRWVSPPEPEPEPEEIPALVPPAAEAMKFRVTEKVTVRKFLGEPNGKPIETLEIDEHGNVTRKE